MKTKLFTRNYLKKKAKEQLWNRELEDIGTIDEFVNTNCYLSIVDLWNIVKWIWKEMPNDNTEIDTWFIYWNEIIDYLTAIVSTHLYNYIMNNLEKWGTTLKNDF